MYILKLRLIVELDTGPPEASPTDKDAFGKWNPRMQNCNMCPVAKAH